jgi:hypothetical protein
MTAADGVRPGGGKNPLPFSSGGGFAGISGPAFYKRWVRRASRIRPSPARMLADRNCPPLRAISHAVQIFQPAVYPLFATMGLATGVFIYALSRVRARPFRLSRACARHSRTLERSLSLSGLGARPNRPLRHAQEFGTNPKYTIMKGRRCKDHVKPTEAEGERFVGNRLIPHAKSPFNMFPFSFKPIETLKRFEGGNCE